MALYDAEIAQNDAAFGDLLDEIERRGLDRSSAVVLTADHGEEFFDHGGWKHGYTLYEEMLRVPLILRLPGNPGERTGRAIARPADQVDIAPTFLALAGAPVGTDLPGRDLRALADEAHPDGSPVPASFAWLEPREASSSSASPAIPASAERARRHACRSSGRARRRRARSTISLAIPASGRVSSISPSGARCASSGSKASSPSPWRATAVRRRRRMR